MLQLGGTETLKAPVHGKQQSRRNISFTQREKEREREKLKPPPSRKAENGWLYPEVLMYS